MTSKSEVIKDKIESKENLLALGIAIVRKLEKLTNLNKKISFELMSNSKDLKDPSRIADHIAAQLKNSIFEKQKLLEKNDFQINKSKKYEK